MMVVFKTLPKSSSPERFKAELHLNYYLQKNFEPEHARKLKKRCQEVTKKLHENSHLSMEQLSPMIQDFYTYIANQAISYGPTGCEYSTGDFLERVESYLCVHAHELLFFTRADEEAIDLSLQDWIRRMHWVTQGFLETTLNFESAKVEELLIDAMADISDMNSHKRIKEKFNCLLRCSKNIFAALTESMNETASADEFFPAFVYVILKSNPTLLKSNLKFIQHFSLPSRIYLGETGYYFTNLCSAVRFIQELNPENLKMSKDVFDHFLSIHTNT